MRPSTLYLAVTLAASFGAGATTAFGATSQPFLSKTNQIFALNLGEDLYTSSSFVCGFLIRKCTFEWYMEYLARDPSIATMDVTWDKSGINLTATLGYAATRSARWTTEINNGIGNPNPSLVSAAPITFKNIGPSGGLTNTKAAADYYMHPSGSPPVKEKSFGEYLEDIGDWFGLTTTLSGGGSALAALALNVQSDAIAKFHSEVEKTAMGYEYIYRVENLGDTPLEYDWEEAGLSGVLDPMETLVQKVLSDLEPFETFGYLSAGPESFGARGPASTFVPGIAAAVPLPAGVLLALTGVLALAGLKSRRV